MTTKDKEAIKGIIYGYFNGSNDYNPKECDRLLKIVESLPASQPTIEHVCDAGYGGSGICNCDQFTH